MINEKRILTFTEAVLKCLFAFMVLLGNIILKPLGLRHKQGKVWRTDDKAMIPYVSATKKLALT